MPESNKMMAKSSVGNGQNDSSNEIYLRKALNSLCDVVYAERVIMKCESSDENTYNSYISSRLLSEQSGSSFLRMRK